MRLTVAAVALALWLTCTVAGVAAATIPVTTTADTSAVACTLRAAITAANTDAASGACPGGAGDDVLELAGLSGTVALATTLPDVTSNLRIHGPGAAVLTLDGQDSVPVLRMTGGTATITDLTIARGLAPTLSQGGGILILGGTLGLARVVVRDCAAYNGGGISHNGGGTLTIEDSAIHDNRTTGNSGAGIIATSPLVLRDTTISNNTNGDANRAGAGLLVQGSTTTATIANCTFARNKSTTLDGSAIANIPPTGTIHLANTIVAHSTGDNCSGPIVSDGHNLSDDDSCDLTGPGDLPSTESDLDDLRDNGGPTPTIALAPLGAATDAGDPRLCPPTDQRGIGRPVDGNGDGVAACDIGAFELGCADGLPAGRPCGPDSTPCTDDVCDAAGTCQHFNNTAPCEDGDPCTLGDACADGVCTAGAAVTCPVVGSLAYQDCITGEAETGPAGTNACAASASVSADGANSGLDRLGALVVSPDGKSLYTASELDHAVARFDRDPATGGLTYQGCITGELTMRQACTEIGSAALDGVNSGLAMIESLAISADGTSLYAASDGDDAVARFDRDPATGALAYQDCITGKTASGPTGTGACVAIGSATATGAGSGLHGIRAVAVPADGTSLYAAAEGDDAVARFDRDPTTGVLTYRDCISGNVGTGPSGTSACTLIGSATAGGDGSGLANPAALVLSADGRSLYVAAAVDDAVARFDRDPVTGALDYQGCISGQMETGPSGTNACAPIGSATAGGDDSGFDDILSLALSADGRSLYAAAEGDAALARFDRDPATGALTYGGCLTGELESGAPTPVPGSGACTEVAGATPSGIGSGLASPRSMAVSADGRSVYLSAADDDAVAHFVRDPSTGALTYDHCLTGASESGPMGTNACRPIGTVASLGANSGVDFPQALALSPDGHSLYTASANDAAVARFAAEPGPPAQPIGGKLLVILDRAAAKRKVVFISKDGRLDASAGSIDPTSTGAVFQVFNNAGTGDSACFDLPAPGWSAKGTGARRALHYRDKHFAQGACKLVAMKHAKLLKVVCQAKVKPVDYSLDEPSQRSVGVRFRSGETEYCAVFGGTIAKDRQGKAFKAKNAPPPETCPVTPVACP